MWLPWFVLRLLLGQMLCGCFVTDEILVLITMGKSGLRLLIFFVKGMCMLVSWLINNLFIENHFISIIDFHLVCSYNSLWLGIVYLCIVFVNIWVLVQSPHIFCIFLLFFFFLVIFFSCDGRWLLLLAEMSSCIMMSNMNTFRKKKKI